MTRLYVSPHAKGLISIICDEFALQAERVAGGFLEPDRVQECLIERLNLRSRKDPALRAFLEDVGPISRADDDSPDRPWAPDPREDSFHEVRNGPGTPSGLKKSARRVEEELDHPMPGERIA